MGYAQSFWHTSFSIHIKTHSTKLPNIFTRKGFQHQCTFAYPWCGSITELPLVPKRLKHRPQLHPNHSGISTGSEIAIGVVIPIIVIGVVIAGFIWYQKMSVQKRKHDSEAFSSLEPVETEKVLAPHGRDFACCWSLDYRLIASQNWKLKLHKLLSRRLLCLSWKDISQLPSSLQVPGPTIMNLRGLRLPDSTEISLCHTLSDLLLVFCLLPGSHLLLSFDVKWQVYRQEQVWHSPIPQNHHYLAKQIPFLI